MNNPIVSVIMSVYKEPVEWLHQSIDSILNQSFTDFEFIIICDNPEYNEGIVLLKDYVVKDNRIRLIFNDVNIGLTKSLNKGLAVARGEYIARMDADDESTPDRLLCQVKVLESYSETGLCHSNCYNMNSLGEITTLHYMEDSKVDQEFLVWDNPFIHSSVMFRRELLELRTPFYNENFRSTQDYELWTFLALHDVIFKYINKPLIKYRYSVNQVSTKGRQKQRNNMISIRRNYIIQRLLKLGAKINEDESNVKLFDTFKKYEQHFCAFERTRVLFLLYHSLTNRVSWYAIRFFVDKNKLWLIFGCKYSFYILLHPFVNEERWRFFSLR